LITTMRFLLLSLVASVGVAFTIPSFGGKGLCNVNRIDAIHAMSEQESCMKMVKRDDATSNTGLLEEVNQNVESKQIEEVIVGDSAILLESNMDVIDENAFMTKDFIATFALCWFVALLSSLDRVAMSVAILPLSSEFHLSDTMKGEISSVFSIGYGLAIIPCGLLAATASPRLIMGIGVTLWSLATFGTPIAASLIQVTQMGVESLSPEATAAVTVFVAANVAPLLFTRSVMGGAESVVLPATQRLLANWVPASKKSIAVASIFSGFQIGTVSAYLLSPWVMDNLGGWRGLFYVYGAIGALWLVPWTLYSKDGPVDANALSTECVADDVPILVNSMVGDDASLVVENRCLDKDGSSIPDNKEQDATASAWNDALEVIKDAPWSSFAKSKAVWAMVVAHAANNWGLYNMLSWTPTFYAEQYDLNVKESAFFSVFPSIAGAICGLSAGFIADKVISSFESDDIDEVKTVVRKTFQGIALLGPAACLLTLSSHIPDDPSTAQALLMGTVGLQAFNAAGYGSSPQEKAGEKWSGLIYSITTLPGVVFGSFGVYATGQILDMTGQNWSQVFSINAGIDVVGALAFIALYNSKKEFD
jgi:ACS family sodium-dependent inorganic phosphate cotransporter